MSTMNKALLQDKDIPLDRMRYTKNATSSRLVILAILFDVFYFVSLYKSDAGTYYYSMLTGASIIYNLIFLLAAFLSEEGVKVRKSGFSTVLFALGLIQFGRIFIIPVQAHSTTVTVSGVASLVMGDAQFIRIVIYLVLSGICCIAAGVTSRLQNQQLKAYLDRLAQAEK